VSAWQQRVVHGLWQKPTVIEVQLNFYGLLSRITAPPLSAGEWQDFFGLIELAEDSPWVIVQPPMLPGMSLKHPLDGKSEDESRLCSAYRAVRFHDDLHALLKCHKLSGLRRAAMQEALGRKTEKRWLRWLAVREAHREGFRVWYKKKDKEEKDEDAYDIASKRLKGTPAYRGADAMRGAYKEVQSILGKAGLKSRL
jgi:hypothetical protein